MQQAWLQKRLDTFLPGADAQARHRHVGRADARVQRGPGLHRDRRRPRRSRRGGARSTCSSTSARRPARRRRPPCVERIALGGTSQGGVFEARRSTQAGGRRRRPRPAGRALGRRAVAGAEDASSRSASRSVIGINRSTVFAFSDGLSSGELEGMSARARRRRGRRGSSDAEGAAARADRVAAAGGGGVLPTHAGARLVDDADDVLGEGDHAGQDAHERPRVVVAAARQRPRARHLVPAERRRAAPGRDRASSSATIRSSSAATCCTATSASPSRASTPTRSTSPTCCARARPTRPPDCGRRSPTPTRCRTSSMEEIRPGRTGNEILAASLARMKARRDRRHDLLASDRPARPRRRPAHRPVGLPGRRARAAATRR